MEKSWALQLGLEFFKLISVLRDSFGLASPAMSRSVKKVADAQWALCW
jgi:hypothetical protein